MARFPQTCYTQIRLLDDGDEDAWTHFERTYWHSSVDQVFDWCGDRKRAEDIVQDLMLKWSRRKIGFDPSRGKFRTWLYCSLLRKFRDTRRKALAGRRIPMMNLDSLNAPADPNDPEGSTRESTVADPEARLDFPVESQAELENIIRTVVFASYSHDLLDVEVFILRTLGMTFREIAAIFKKSLGWSTKAYQRALDWRDQINDDVA